MGRRLNRLHQMAAAAVAAGLLAIIGAPDPIQEMTWIALSKTQVKEVSGQIVVVDVDQAAATDASIAQRQATAIREVSSRSPSGIFLQGNFALDDQGLAALREAIGESDIPVTIGWEKHFTGGTDAVAFTTRRLTHIDGTTTAIDAYQYTALGLAWRATTSFPVDGREIPSFAAAIAGVDAPQHFYLIDYRYANAPLPIIPAEQLASSSIDLSGKAVLIGSGAVSRQEAVRIPGGMVPRTQMALIAAESLLQGPPVRLHWLATLALAVAFIFAGAYSPTTIRRGLYAVAAIYCLAMPFAAARFDMFAENGAAVVFLLLFFGLRARSVWKERAAGTDRVTGLANFTALRETIEQQEEVLIIARVDRFEEVLANLEPGLHVTFAQQIAERLRTQEKDIIYSDGTGNFAWTEDIARSGDRLAELVALSASPIRIGERTLDFTCSFGIQDVMISNPLQAISATVVAAELASGRVSAVAFVSEQQGVDATWRLSLHSSLDQAIASGDIYLVYQPQVAFDGKELVGAEALVRWKHPERGEISPKEFIPQVERAGRLKPLTAQTLRMASRTATLLPRHDLRISVNVSATLLGDDNFVELVRHNVLAGGASANQITLEITETAKIEDLEKAAVHLHALRQKGFKVSLDDFGTGEANLSLLVQLPCDELKLDQTFVRLAQTNERARTVITVLAETARLSGMSLVAEGIETQADQTILSSLGCKIGQGFYHGHPVRDWQLIAMAEQKEALRA